MTDLIVSQCCTVVQIHVRIQREHNWQSIPVALFLQLLPRRAASSKAVSQWRTRAVFATHARSDDAATATSGIVELELSSGALHVRCSIGIAMYVLMPPRP